MVQRFRDTRSAILRGNKSSLFANCCLNLFDRIGGTGNKPGKSPIQHGQIVKVITRGECLVRRDAQEPLQLGQRRPLVVGNVAKAQINRISLKSKFRECPAPLINKPGDRIHLRVIAGNNPCKLPLLTVGPRPRFAFNVSFDLPKQTLDFTVENSVILQTPRIPLPKILPPRIGPAKDFPFSGKREIRANWKTRVFQPLFNQMHRAPGVQRNRHAMLPKSI